jgi:hypothetical protein
MVSRNQDCFNMAICLQNKSRQARPGGGGGGGEPPRAQKKTGALSRVFSVVLAHISCPSVEKLGVGLKIGPLILVPRGPDDGRRSLEKYLPVSVPRHARSSIGRSGFGNRESRTRNHPRPPSLGMAMGTRHPRTRRVNTH